jgi:hypothetical protein
MSVSREAMVVTATLTAVTTWFVLSALTLSPTAAIVPLTVGVPTVLLFAWIAVGEMRKARRPAEAVNAGRDPAHLPDARREREAMWWLLALAALVWAFGALTALPLYLLLAFAIRSGVRWRVSVAAALVCWAIVDLVLRRALGVEFPGGALLPWLGP